MKDSNIWVRLLGSPHGPSEHYKLKFPRKLVDNGCVPNKPTAFDQDEFVDTCFDTMCTQMDEVIQFVHSHYDGLKLFGLSIIKRRNWYPIICTLSARLNGYMSKTHRVRMCQMNDRIPDDHFETDEIHLNAQGYSVFVSKGMGPMLDNNYMSLEPPKKKPKTQFP